LSEEKYEENMKYIADIGRMMLSAGEPAPCLQFKVSAGSVVINDV
jgi:hypothetical protein